ncbi:sulfate transporter [Neisseria wadsworthii 9715]|uniref:Sulfate transporter n=1 Tax=Neisseria wadsworthii 9715 TaxID=1030841 RepID=G4CN58_9NEIS|nr:sulfate transporter [Neisseria wadsworthii 9715]
MFECLSEKPFIVGFQTGMCMGISAGSIAQALGLSLGMADIVNPLKEKTPVILRLDPSISQHY